MGRSPCHSQAVDDSSRLPTTHFPQRGAGRKRRAKENWQSTTVVPACLFNQRPLVDALGINGGLGDSLGRALPTETKVERVKVKFLLT